MTIYETSRKALIDVDYERQRQDLLWGEQNHPSSGGPESRRQAARKAQDWKDENRCRVDDGNLTWDGILLEEVYEALAEEDPAKRRVELIQVAATAIAEVECIDRQARPASSVRDTAETDATTEPASELESGPDAPSPFVADTTYYNPLPRIPLLPPFPYLETKGEYR